MDPSWYDHFARAMDTPAADSFVCHVMHDSCPDVWAANDLTSVGECEAKLAALPLTEGDHHYIDGNSCASPHTFHSAHLSRAPHTVRRLV